MHIVNATQMTAISRCEQMTFTRVELCFLVISSFFVLISDFKILALKSRRHHPEVGREGPQPSVNSSYSHHVR